MDICVSKHGACCKADTQYAYIVWINTFWFWKCVCVCVRVCVNFRAGCMKLLIIVTSSKIMGIFS